MSNKSKVYGVIPSRMASSRFPGKPLHLIKGRAMVEHVYYRAKMYDGFDGLVVALCDDEIENFVKARDIPFVRTANTHTRCLDRVEEAVKNFWPNVDQDDIVVCVQGDEPMLRPDMIGTAAKPLIEDAEKATSVLAMEIPTEELFLNPDTVKIAYNQKNEVLYTSRAPIPYSTDGFSSKIGARRIYGILAWRWRYLQKFSAAPENHLELIESCDSNRILDLDFIQHIAPYPFVPSYSIDSPSDVQIAEREMDKDPYWGKY